LERRAEVLGRMKEWVLGRKSNRNRRQEGEKFVKDMGMLGGDGPEKGGVSLG